MFISDYILEQSTNKTAKHNQYHQIDWIIHKIKLNTNISIYNLKELIYYLTDISIENQHIEYYNKLNKNYESLDYIYQHSTLDILINTSLNNLDLDNLEYIENLFIDKKLNIDIYGNATLIMAAAGDKTSIIYLNNGT